MLFAAIATSEKCGFHSCATNTLHTRLRVQRAPGIPHALNGGERFMYNSDASRREA
jgi:hypothetical protein